MKRPAEEQTPTQAEAEQVPAEPAKKTAKAMPKTKSAPSAQSGADTKPVAKRPAASKAALKRPAATADKAYKCHYGGTRGWGIKFRGHQVMTVGVVTLSAC